MSIRFPTLALVLMLSLLTIRPVAAQDPLALDFTGKESLDIGTSTSEIAITSDFSGAEPHHIRGARQYRPAAARIGQYDVVVTWKARATGRPCGARSGCSGSGSTARR